MVVKVYISGISGNKEVKKRQQRVLMILDSKNVEYEVIDITEPGKEDEKEFMQTNGKARDSKYPLPPQIFNDDDYCGDYENFDLANEIDELEQFLKTMGDDILDDDEKEKSQSQNNSHNKQNGNSASREVSTEKDVSNVVTENETDDRQNSTADDIDNDNEENDDEEKSKSLDEDDENDDIKKSEKKEESTDKSKEQEE